VSKGFDADEFESHGSTWQLQKKKNQKYKSSIKLNQSKLKEKRRKRERN